MALAFENFAYKYERNGKPVFAPNDRSYRIGRDIKQQVEQAILFPNYVYHLQHSGGHVAAIHAHRSHKYFAKVDISRYFYSVSRNRVARSLRSIGIARAEHYAKWSCIKNPYGNPTYSLPYVFVQSPILATLALLISEVGQLLGKIDGSAVTSTLYMDDISLSSDDRSALETVYIKVCETLEQEGFVLSTEKLLPPSTEMTVFNCDLQEGIAKVSDERVAIFHSHNRTAQSVDAFENYCASVVKGNIP